VLRRLSGALAVGGGVARGGRMVMLAFSTQVVVNCDPVFSSEANLVCDVA
jgi:hypothetical protein